MAKSTVDFGYIIELGEGKPAFLLQTLKLFLDQTQKLMGEYRQAVKEAWDPKAMEIMAHGLKSGFGLVQVDGALPLLEAMEKNGRHHHDEDLARVQWKSFEEIWERATGEIRQFQTRLVGMDAKARVRFPFTQ